MIFNKMIPELTVFDLDQTIKFYKDLGFIVEYERPTDKFVFMSFEESQFMFEQFHDDGWNIGDLKYPLGQGINFSIKVKNIENLYENLKEKQITFYRDMNTIIYHVNGIDVEQKEFLLQDINGYLLRFTD